MDEKEFKKMWVEAVLKVVASLTVPKKIAFWASLQPDLCKALEEKINEIRRNKETTP